MQKIPFDIHIIAVGKIKSMPFAGACSHYLTKLSHYLNVDMIEVRDVVGKRKNDLEAVHSEGRMIQKALRQQARYFALDNDGYHYCSEKFADKLKELAETGTRKFDFMIGGPMGLSDDIKKDAHEKLSLSAMTLPHELARIVLLEQLFRACTILRGEKYHK